MSRSDPIRDRYFTWVTKAAQVSGWLFYAGAALSLATLLVSKSDWPRVYDALLATFCIAVVSLFAVNLVSRLYLTPRAEDKRRRDFFSSASGVNLTHEQTDGYYNNDERLPVRRIAAQVLENSHFSKAIALKMAQEERAKCCLYALLWLIFLLNRKTDLGIILAVSQVVFSEQVLARWIRLEWLRSRIEWTYENTYRLFQSNPRATEFNAMALELLLTYETAKANAAITLSTRHFNSLNAELSEQWGAIKAAVRLNARPAEP